jgi:16S rRNA processing protein RimM
LQNSKFITLGKITKPIGLKGYVKVLSLTDFPERFSELNSLKIFNEKENSVLFNKFSDSENFFVRDAIIEKEAVKVLFEGYDDINSVGKMLGCLIVIEESKRAKLAEGQYYLYELVDLDVIVEGKKMGRTVSIENYGGQDLFKIKLDENNKEVLIPFVDDFVKHIDIDKKIIEMEVIDGMLN